MPRGVRHRSRASYRLDERVGRGATGEVWRGVDRRTDEPVAAKILHREHLEDDTLVERFVRERSILVGCATPTSSASATSSSRASASPSSWSSSAGARCATPFANVARSVRRSRSGSSPRCSTGSRPRTTAASPTRTSSPTTSCSRRRGSTSARARSSSPTRDRRDGRRPSRRQHGPRRHAGVHGARAPRDGRRRPARRRVLAPASCSTSSWPAARPSPVPAPATSSPTGTSRARRRGSTCPTPSGTPSPACSRRTRRAGPPRGSRPRSCDAWPPPSATSTPCPSRRRRRSSGRPEARRPRSAASSCRRRPGPPPTRLSATGRPAPSAEPLPDLGTATQATMLRSMPVLPAEADTGHDDPGGSRRRWRWRDPRVIAVIVAGALLVGLGVFFIVRAAGRSGAETATAPPCRPSSRAAPRRAASASPARRRGTRPAVRRPSRSPTRRRPRRSAGLPRGAACGGRRGRLPRGPVAGHRRAAQRPLGHRHETPCAGPWTPASCPRRARSRRPRRSCSPGCGRTRRPSCRSGCARGRGDAERDDRQPGHQHGLPGPAARRHPGGRADADGEREGAPDPAAPGLAERPGRPPPHARQPGHRRTGPVAPGRRRRDQRGAVPRPVLRALSISKDGLVVQAQSVAQDCTIGARVGNFTNLASQPFEITTRGS